MNLRLCTYPNTEYTVSTKKVIEFPFRYVNIESVGQVFYPYIKAKLATTQGWKEFTFIVDTGADLTTLPRYMVPILNINLDKSKKSTSIGIGGKILNTWLTSIPIHFNGYTTTIRCSVTDELRTPLLLGRVDLLETNMSWHFDSRRRKIVFEILK